jgi:hypothetical protein
VGGDVHSLQNLGAALSTTYGNLVNFRVQPNANLELTVATLIVFVHEQKAPLPPPRRGSADPQSFTSGPIRILNVIVDEVTASRNDEDARQCALPGTVSALTKPNPAVVRLLHPSVEPSIELHTSSSASSCPKATGRQRTRSNPRRRWGLA